jgi:hypothetical protein
VNQLILEWNEFGQLKRQTIFEEQPSKVPGRVRIGQDAMHSDIMIMESGLAPCHVEIFFNPQQQCFCIRNLATYLPLVINGMALPNSETMLHEGATVQLGSVTIIVQNLILATQHAVYQHQQPYSAQKTDQDYYTHSHQMSIADTYGMAQTMVNRNSGQLFYYIPVTRLVTMSILSGGLYDLYWMYKNYRYLKKRDGLRVLAFWRGVFGVVFCHDLFKRIASDRMLYPNRPVEFSPDLLSMIWAILYCLSIFTGFRDDPSRTLLVSLISAPLSAMCFISLQNHINDANERIRPGQSFSPWSIGDAICLVAGLFFWFSVVMDAAGLL